MRKRRAISCPNCGSQIIHRTGLELKEKFMAYLVPTEMFECQPCGCRFARRGNPFTRKNYRRILIPMILIVVFLSLIIAGLTRGGGKSPGPVVSEKREQKIAVLTPEIEEGKKRPPADSTPVPVQKPAKMPVKTIALGASRIFGVNWEYNGTGLEITRLSPGPLQRAGFKIGDILVSVDGKPLNDETIILRARNEIFAGERNGAIIEAVRGDEKFVYKLIK